MCDWKANRGRRRIQISLFLFRFAKSANGRYGRWSFPLTFMYRQYALSYVGFDIPINTDIGPGLQIHHGIGLVVNGSAKIGQGVQLRQNTTIGSRLSSTDSPTIGNGVEVGANCVVMGEILVGDQSVIGAGTVLLHSVPRRSVVFGNPGKMHRTLEGTSMPGGVL
ncbi:serine acetyltransferase [Rhodococcus sp. MALMAid1271]|uniref:serine acetyltransferase n=1 Tax=Rhodococcus sp. MALMAid1271 TaxID=3411744 RepID=UPI003BA05E67